MKKLIGLLFVLGCNFSAQAFATDYTVSICSIQSGDNTDTGFIDPCGPRESQSNCTSGGWITWDMSSRQGKAMYATALTAFSLGKNIQVRLTDDSCLGAYDRTSMIRILQ